MEQTRTAIESIKPDAALPAALAPAASVTPVAGALSRGHVGRFYLLYMLGALFPLSMGLALYGWRGLAVVGIVVASASLTTLVWRRIGRRGAALHLSQIVWLALLMGMMLPAHLTMESASNGAKIHGWAIAAAAGMLVVISTWVFGAVGFSRIQPLMVAYLAILLVFYPVLEPQLVLHKTHAVFGDLRNYDASGQARHEAWVFSRRDINAPDAYLVPTTAARHLTRYTHGNYTADLQEPVSIQTLIRDDLPPLEDLVVGGHPGPIGASSAIAVIIGGLFLLYRGLIDYRVPLYVTFFAFVGFLILPVPVAVNETGAQWQPPLLPFARLELIQVVSFANYQLVAGSLLLVAFFMATAPSICPLDRRARGIYAIVLGLAIALCQTYVSVASGPYVALLLVGLIVPWLEDRFRSSPLV